MQRLAVHALIPILLALALAPPAQAAIWCKTDPVVALDGRLVDIQVAVPLEYVLAVNGPIQVQVQTPKTVHRELILNDLGYNGHGTEVTFVDGGGVVKDKRIPTRVTVSVPIDPSLLPPDTVVPVEATVMPDNALPVVAEGTSERTVVDLTVLAR
jgi:hypothetical protein